MGRKDWETPDEIFRYFDNKYHFTLDAAAEPHNTKLPNYLTGPCYGGRDCECGICLDWSGEVVWLNPPYVDLDKWATKCDDMGDLGVPIVMLVLNATETDWFETAWKTSHIKRILKKRINFKNSPTGNRQGSVIFEWNPPYTVEKDILIWDWKRDCM